MWHLSGPESGLQSQLKARLEFYGEARVRPHYEKGEECSGLHHEGTGIRDKENNKEKSGVLCDSHRCDGKGTEYQPKCTFHLFWACSPKVRHLLQRKGSSTNQKWRKWKPSKHKFPVLTTAQTTLLSMSLPVEGGFLFPLHYSTLGQVSSKLLRICPISSLPLCLALWVLPSPLTSFLAAQTQQSPSNYCFPKVHTFFITFQSLNFWLEAS